MHDCFKHQWEKGGGGGEREKNKPTKKKKQTEFTSQTHQCSRAFFSRFILEAGLAADFVR